MNKNSISLIDKNCVISGDFASIGTVDVSGKIIGNVIIEALNVKDGGVITGKVYAKELNITGGSSVEGDVYAGKIKVCNKSQISGNIYYYILSIEDGGILKGGFENKTKEQMDEILTAKCESYHNVETEKKKK